MVVVLALNLVIGLGSGFIDNWGHIGGLLGGMLVTFGIMPRYRQPEVLRLGAQPLAITDRRPAEIAWTVLCLIVLAAGVYAATLYRYG